MLVVREVVWDKALRGRRLMRLIKNSGNDRVIDELRQALSAQSSLDVASPAFSLFAFAELRTLLESIERSRLVVPTAEGSELRLLGTASDRPFRNQLRARALARQCADWIEQKVEVRSAPGPVPQSTLITGHPEPGRRRVITGDCPFTTEGLGLTPGNQFSLVQCSEGSEEWAVLGGWFSALWNSLPSSPEAKSILLGRLQELVAQKPPSLIYYLTLYHLFKDLGEDLDVDRAGEFPSIRNINNAIRRLNLAAEGELDLLIATDCISEGQNLQDCDYLVNYDIHWNPVRIIQRFGRIARIGSPNTRIQLVNFWPNMELEEYINLEQRVIGRMVLLDISATGEENLIEQQSGNQMNDLEYRRKQLLKLQDAVIDLEDLSSGVSIANLTLTDFRIDLAGFLKDHSDRLESPPPGSFAVTTANGSGEAAIPPGVIFCLRAEGDAAAKTAEPGYPLAPHYLVHVGDDGAVLLPFTQAKQVLDRLKGLCIGRDLPDAQGCARFDKATRDGENMAATQKLLAAAVASIVGKKEERSVASLFTPGGTDAMKGEFAGSNDFEVVAFLVILPEPSA